MTAFDRFEQNLPEFMDRLASAQVPDYFDDMLQRTARTRQRPAWSSLERWLPMGVLARPALVPSLPWRPIGIVALLLILVVVGAFVLAGSQRRLPPPFGLARNGAILYSTTDGDIFSVDPATGAASAIVAGPTRDFAPQISRDGTQFLFIRDVSGTTKALVVANIDGSGMRTLAEGTYASELDSSPFDWSPNGTRIAVTALHGGSRGLTILATDGSAPTTFDLGMEVFDVTWRPGSDELLFRGKKPESAETTYGLYRVRSDGSGLQPILPVNTLEFGWQTPVVSHDGRLAAFARWGGPPEGINIVDIDAGTARVLTFPGREVGPDQYQPLFSPDGTHIAFVRYRDREYQLNVVQLDGGAAVPVGPVLPESAPGPFFNFSPDGAVVLATYTADGSSWILDPGAGADQQVTWPGTEFQSWQRLAP